MLELEETEPISDNLMTINPASLAHRQLPIPKQSPAHRALMSQREHITSTPPSSIDLEWELECGMPDLILDSQKRLLKSEEEDEEDDSVRHLGSSPSTSLEWDATEQGNPPLGDNPMYNIDHETEELIQEIEQLTARALQETGLPLR
ncbi:unnamed protein product [Darwinula stevensoni]|uniref:Uncharacterized protein n=1 Tax=Darwinula stevensoni TaxID=69355 RepID=A0A7R8XC32_9CRUS|nr:unnamed protein product [Darwinula stevensoni]CAG0888425.1 unnamed protein product [Darwinula stevensoni]